ncbi:MAG TPA: antibiotic biosynthesis monooxygenase family protein [Anaerolineales bacterium]|nr:antibiotic biosynthesis monooxygenase family protein [Anaerolineales bacterium]
MPTIGQHFAASSWLVREGKESEFITAWSRFAEWTSRSGLGAGTGHLLRDEADPRRFLSFGAWDSDSAIQRWRSAPEFKSFVATARELCEDFQPRTLELVALAKASS